MKRHTQSICPICHKAVEAAYVRENGSIYFEITCPAHGSFRTLAAERAGDFELWIQNPVVNIPPKTVQTEGDPKDRSCPLHCGTCENHLQTACCVLMDITDRCNQHCPYCFARAEAVDAAGNAEPMPAKRGEPSLEELEAKLDLLLELGEERPFNIQLSGGEPTIRDDLPEIIRMARQKGFEYIQINTNGKRLALEEGYPQVLKAAGASVIFLQFDGTRDHIYETLRGEPLFAIKKQAIRNCEKAGLPVTLVPTVVEGVNADNLGEMMDFLIENVNVVKGIHFQPVSFFGRHPEEGQMAELQRADLQKTDFSGRITMFGLLRKLEAQSPRFKYDDFCPISTGHPLCCFYSTYIKEPDGSIRCTLSSTQKQAGIGCCDMQGAEGCCDMQGAEGCCDAQSAEGCCDAQGAPDCCCMPEPDSLEIIRKDRDFVLNKWETAPPEDAGRMPCCTSADQITDLDEFLRYYRRNTFTVTGMAFQDITNLDAERVKRCRVQQLSPGNRLIPFCAYNALYRKQ